MMSTRVDLWRQSVRAAVYTVILAFPSAALAEESGTTPRLPSPADRHVDFQADVLPILLTRCAGCHTGERARSGLLLDSRETLLEGGYSGDAVVVGNSEEGELVALVSRLDPSRVMPLAGTRLSNEEVGLIRAWIDQGLAWPDGFNLAETYQARIAPRRPEPPQDARSAASDHPIDRLLGPYFARHGVPAAESVPDRIFTRRVYLDLIGLLPSPEELADFENDSDPEKRPRLVRRLLSDRQAYATHWLTFWNDALRNNYHGTGFIDGGREQITGWLYRALYENKPYDRFVHELIRPVAGSEGFVKGIKWRGVVNASQLPQMQAAQNVAQVFLGTNLKCASCHDSFVNEWTLEDSYALAGVFADGPLEMHRCDKPTGEVAEPAFLFAQLGQIDSAAPKPERMAQLADVVTSADNGRLARTIVNRLWARLFGRGIVEPVDDMDQTPFCGDLLDWLAADLHEHDYDVKHTLEVICTSLAYQRPSVGAPRPEETSFVFRGPIVRRMEAEQFVDAVSTLTGVWQEAKPRMSKPDGRGQGGQLTAVRELTGDVAPIRAALADEDPLMRALGRPNREQVVTRRESIATTLQALELTNGPTLDRILATGARNWLNRPAEDSEQLVDAIYRTALGRSPVPAELSAARQLLRDTPSEASVQDLLWAVVMLPEFQLIQ